MNVPDANDPGSSFRLPSDAPRKRAPKSVAPRTFRGRVAAGVVQNVADLARDPQLVARGFFETIRHLTRGAVVATGIPLGLTDTPARSGVAGQAIGQDNHYVFGELLGMTAGEIAAATASGAIEQSG